MLASISQLPASITFPFFLISEFPASSSRLAIEPIDPLQDPRWDRLVLSHPDANFFHSTTWARVLSSTYDHKPHYLRFTVNGETAALLPVMEIRSWITGRRGVTLPFSDFCDPLFFDEGIAASLINTLVCEARDRKWKHFEVRGSDAFEECLTPSVQYYGHALDLCVGADQCLARCKSSVRRAIRKAVRSGLTVELSRSREAMLDFYRLHVRTRKRHGVPPQPQSFFLNIHKHVMECGNGFTALARKGMRPVASAVFCHFGRAAVFKFGASDERFQGVRANNLVMWEGIKGLVDEKIEILHFGRTSLENHGLRRFKLGWGTREEKVKYFRFDTRGNKWLPGHDNIAGLHTSLFKRLPLKLNRLAGALIYPHLG